MQVDRYPLQWREFKVLMGQGEMLRHAKVPDSQSPACLLQQPTEVWKIWTLKSSCFIDPHSWQEGGTDTVQTSSKETSKYRAEPALSVALLGGSPEARSAQRTAPSPLPTGSQERMSPEVPITHILPVPCPQGDDTLVILIVIRLIMKGT